MALTSIDARSDPPECPPTAELGEKRRDDILAWFDHPGSSNGPTEAINGRLEHLRAIALGFRNLVNYRLRSLLEAGGFRPPIHSLS
nr:transposase [Propioniciclava sp. MC1595]